MDLAEIIRVCTVVIKQYDQKQPGEKSSDCVLLL